MTRKHQFIITIYDSGTTFSSDFGPVDNPGIWDCTTDATLEEALKSVADAIQHHIESE